MGGVRAPVPAARLHSQAQGRTALAVYGCFLCGLFEKRVLGFSLKHPWSFLHGVMARGNHFMVVNWTAENMSTVGACGVGWRFKEKFALLRWWTHVLIEILFSCECR